MLLPHELKEKTFSRVMRGYNPAEVDDYLDFIIEKYSELYRENDDLARKLNAAVAKIEELGSGDAAVRATLINAKKAADRIVEEANGRADMILNSIKGRSDAILAEYKAKIKAEQQALAEIEHRIAKFKAVLYEEYSAHIDAIEKLTDSADSLPDEDFDYVGTVVAGVKEDLTAVVEADTEPVSDEYSEEYSENAEYAEEVSADEAYDETYDEYIDEYSGENAEEEYSEEYSEEYADEEYAGDEYAEEYADEYAEDYSEYVDEEIVGEKSESKKMGFLARHGYTLRKEKEEGAESSEDEFDLLYSDDQGE